MCTTRSCSGSFDFLRIWSGRTRSSPELPVQQMRAATLVCSHGCSHQDLALAGLTAAAVLAITLPNSRSARRYTVGKDESRGRQPARVPMHIPRRTTGESGFKLSQQTSSRFTGGCFLVRSNASLGFLTLDSVAAHRTLRARRRCDSESQASKNFHRVPAASRRRVFQAR